jgi:membrane-bound lytic murein transglycosylase D
MTWKILWTGLILILLPGCFPYLGPIPHLSPDVSPTEEAASSLFSPAELDRLFSAEEVSVQGQLPIFPDRPAGEDRVAWRLDCTISDESNDDFNLEFFPQGPPKTEPEFDIPIVMNAKVEQFIRYFQRVGKKMFSNWLARSAKYIPMMKTLLKEHGLPEDLVYLALIESGFNPYAYSRSKASGPWQFIYRTGKKYGLQVTWWVDERRDPEKSTIAAAQYLKDLYDIFECWYLAAAGYNAGEYKIARAMKRYRTEDFWELSKYRYLKTETKNYVPQMIAAALIAKDPETYGFTDIAYQDPLCFDRVTVPEVTGLDLIARACEISLEELRDLNPELLRDCTPPNVQDYEVRIPCGRKEVFVRNFEALRPTQRFQFKAHVVKKGETLWQIARKYRVDMEPLLEINKLKKRSLLSVGTHLLIPLPVQKSKKAALAPSQVSHRGSEEIVYTVKKGDTLWGIAMEMGISVAGLSRWNNLNPEQPLFPGDILQIRTGGRSLSLIPEIPKGKEIVYTIQEGDTLWDIAKKYDLTVAQIQGWNNLREADVIHPADQLKLRIEDIRSSSLN